MKEIIDIVKMHGFKVKQNDGEFLLCQKTLDTGRHKVSVIVSNNFIREACQDECYMIELHYGATAIWLYFTIDQLKEDFNGCLNKACQEFIDELTKAVAAVVELKMTGM